MNAESVHVTFNLMIKRSFQIANDLKQMNLGQEQRNHDDGHGWLRFFCVLAPD